MSATPNPSRIAGLYLVLGLAWSWLSAATIYWQGSFDRWAFVLDGCKDSCIVVLTAGVLYWLISRDYRRLEQSLDLLHAVAEGTTDSIFVKDCAGRYLLMNQEVGRTVGKPIEEILGKDDTALFDRESAERLRQSDLQVMQTNTPMTQEEVVETPTGRKTYLANKVPYHDATGNVIGVIGIARDITDRKRMESELLTARAKSELGLARLEAVLGSLPIGLIYMDVNGNLYNWNAAALEMHGHESIEAARRNLSWFREVFQLSRRGEASLPFEEWPVTRLLRGEAVSEEELIVRRSDRAFERVIRYCGDRIQIEGGRDEVIVLAMQDVTESRSVEESLRASERRFRELADSIPAIVFTAKPDGALDLLNQQAMQYTGVAHDQLVGWSWQSVIHPEDYPRVEEEWHKILQTGEPHEVAFRIRRHDETYRWHVVRQSPSRDERGEIHRWYGTCVDMHELQEARDALHESLQFSRAILNSMSDNIAVLDARGTIIAVNERWRTFAQDNAVGGIPPHHTEVGTNYLEVCDRSATRNSRDAAVAAKGIREVLEGIRGEFRLEYACHSPKERRWFLMRATPFCDGMHGVVITHTNITSRVQADRELREERDRLMRFAESAPGAMYSFRRRADGTTAFPFASPTLYHFFGLSREEVAEDGGRLFARIHPEDVGPLLAGIEASARDLTFWKGQFRYLHPERGEIWLEGRSTPVHETDGSILWHGFVIEITDLKKTEQVLREGEARYRAVIETSPEGFWRQSSEGRLLEVNDAYERVSGYTREELIGMDVDALEAVDLTEDSRVRRNTVIRNGGARFETIHRRKDGSLWPVEVAATYQPIEGGMIVAFLRDITERKKAEKALRESEELYRRLVDVLPTAMFVHSEGRILFCNAAFLALLGLNDASEAVGRHLLDVFHSDYHDTIHRRLLVTRETGSPLSPREETLIRRDGRPFLAYVVATPIAYQGQQGVLALLTDLSERERSMSLLRTVLGTVSDAIMTIDSQGMIRSINPATELMFGYSEHELIGNNIKMLVPEPHRSVHDDYLARYLNVGTPEVIGICREVEAEHQNGRRIPVELTVTEFKMDNARHFTAVVRDISARRRLEDQYRQAQKMEAIGHLAGGVAHDFNNLLTIINGYSEMLLMGMSGEDSRRSGLVAIRDAGERAAHLTAQLLAFSRRTIIEPKILDLNEVIDHMGRMLRRLIGEDVRLTTVLDPLLPWVKTDPGQFEQVLLNLAVNARDAMPRGGHLTIVTRGENYAVETAVPGGDLPPGRYVKITISDTGSGMSEEVQKHIFEPFFTTKEVGKGTGLGLATVYGIINQAGGHIGVTSASGQGTQFTIHLPAVEQVERRRARTSGEHVAPRGSETILVAEDEAAVLQLTRVTLELQGYKVLAAHSGAEAIQMAEMHGEKIALLVTDVVMPDTSGRTLVDALRGRLSHLRVLYMSGYTDDAVVRHGVETARDAFLQKPFTPLALARKVRSVLDGPS